MKKPTLHHKLLWLLTVMAFLLCLCLFVGCTEQEEHTTDVATDTPTKEETTKEVTEEPTKEETESEKVTEKETETVTETETEKQGWKQDTGVFNEGKVTYLKETTTTVHNTFPAEKLGTTVKADENGVITLFDADFSGDDATLDGKASMRHEYSYLIDGHLYVGYNKEAGAYHESGAWGVWAPIADANVKNYAQTQFSLEWDVNSRSTGAWMTASVGCYVTDLNKIPNEPGDGLWFAFQENANQIKIYHPDTQSWASAWASVDVEEGLMAGMHKVNIVCTPDYSTYIYMTVENSTTEKLVCTVRFADGKIKAYDGQNNPVAESACTTNNLGGGYYSIFYHEGGGAKVKDAKVLACTKGETVTNTVIKATPTEGNKLGLDITDKKDLVSICYSVWFDAILGTGDEPVTDWHNITEVLEGKREWGPSPSFHYWAKPAVGYYRSSDKKVIRTHMTQLYEAGVDFIIIDLTNAHDGYLQGADWMNYIQIPMDAICDTIMEMRAEGKGTPYVVFWCGPSCGMPMYQKLYDHYINNEKWKDCFVYWDEKPYIMTVKMPSEFPLPELYTVRSMWGLGTTKYAEGQWCFLSYNNYGKYTTGPDGSIEQVSVATAAQETYMSMKTAHGREGGTFFYQQWYNAFDYRPKIVTLTWWNEWTAQRLQVSAGNYQFTDNYNQNYSRDIEPMEGGHGDQYYRWMIEYISAYKGHLECPELYEHNAENDRTIKYFYKEVERVKKEEARVAGN